LIEEEKDVLKRLKKEKDEEGQLRK